MNPRKVLIVDEGASFGGSLIVASHLINFLDQRRYSAELVCEVDKSVLESHIDPRRLTVIRHGFNYVHHIKFAARISWIRVLLVKKALMYTISAYAFLRNLSYRQRLRQLARAPGVALIHTNNSREAITIGKGLGLPVVWHLHGPLAKRPTRSDRLALQLVDRLIAVSEYVADSVRHVGISDEKLVTIPNPCVMPTGDLRKARCLARKNFGIDTDALVFGIVARIVRWKGHVEFLLAAEQVLCQIPGSVAAIIGDGADFGTDYEQEIRKLAAASAYADRIVFTGYMPNMLTAYAMLDVLVHTSIEPEPFGLVITEAMAHGVAVVAANLGAPKEIIMDGIDGFLVDPKDARCLADTICNLLDDVSERERIAEAARRKVEKEYDPTRFSAAVAALYDTLLSS